MKVPECMGFIIDGNRRWAKENKLPTFKGHKEGLETLKKTVGWARDLGVKNLIFYTFSTENWKRAEEEVANLMGLLKNTLMDDAKVFHENKARFQFVGQKERFSETIQELINKLEEETKHYSDFLVAFALSYGGRAEIVHAANTLLASGKKEITEEDFANNLWTAGIPDPDIIVRTGDAMRLSNFLPWQSVYSELYFTNTFWPDFDKEEFDYVLEEFNNRERRMGK